PSRSAFRNSRGVYPYPRSSARCHRASCHGSAIGHAARGAAEGDIQGVRRSAPHGHCGADVMMIVKARLLRVWWILVLLPVFPFAVAAEETPRLRLASADIADWMEQDGRIL